jgi:hypothetical protein
MASRRRPARAIVKRAIAGATAYIQCGWANVANAIEAADATAATTTGYRRRQNSPSGPTSRIA